MSFDEEPEGCLDCHDYWSASQQAAADLKAASVALAVADECNERLRTAADIARGDVKVQRLIALGFENQAKEAEASYERLARSWVKVIIERDELHAKIAAMRPWVDMVTTDAWTENRLRAEEAEAERARFRATITWASNALARGDTAAAMRALDAAKALV